jgi:DNA-binding GntR family transcriptional regulator
MPVREALKRLESDGSLKSSVKSGFIIPYPTPHEFEEILQIRLRLETMLAHEAVPVIAKDQIDKIEWLQDRMAQSKSWRQVLNYNQQMHFTLYSAADMPYALGLVENIWTRIGPLLHVVYGGQFETTPYEHHYQIIDGLRERQADKVEQAVRLDLIDSAGVIQGRLAEMAGSSDEMQKLRPLLLMPST